MKEDNNNKFKIISFKMMILRMKENNFKNINMMMFLWINPKMQIEMKEMLIV